MEVGVAMTDDVGMVCEESNSETPTTVAPVVLLLVGNDCAWRERPLCVSVGERGREAVDSPAAGRRRGQW